MDVGLRYAARPMRTLGLFLLAVACNKSAPTPGEGSGSALLVHAGTAESAGSPPATAWTFSTHPIDLACGDGPLAMTPPLPTKPSAERQLKRGEALPDCHNQVSVEAVCACLAKSISSWGKSLLLVGPASCTRLSNTQPDVSIVEIVDSPTETAMKTGGSALVMVGKYGQTWTPVAVLAAEGDVDLEATPKLTASLKLISFDAHPGSVYSIETRSETRDSDMGDHTIDGSETTTLCTRPNDSPMFCYSPLKVGTWTYSWTPRSNSCETSALALFAASLDATGATLQLKYGSDADGAAGHYRF